MLSAVSCRALGRELESKLNGDLFPSVRFAEAFVAFLAFSGFLGG